MLCCTSILANSSPNTTPPSQVFPSNGKLTGNTDSVSNKSQVNSSNRRSGKLLLLSFLWNCSAMPFIIISNIVIIQSCNCHDQLFDHQMIMTSLYSYNYRYMHICVYKKTYKQNILYHQELRILASHGFSHVSCTWRATLSASLQAIQCGRKSAFQHLANLACSRRCQVNSRRKNTVRPC